MGKTIFILVISIVVLVGVVLYIREDATAQTVTLYYYNASKDTDAEGNLLCSNQGLEPVERVVQDAEDVEEVIRILLRGELTDDERSRGISTEFPLEGLELVRVERDSEVGLLTLVFTDPLNKTVGGSCRVNILRAQIERTARSISPVPIVRIEPEELFQP